MALMKQLLILWLLAAAAVAQSTTDPTGSTVDDSPTSQTASAPTITESTTVTPTTNESTTVTPTTTKSTNVTTESTTVTPTTTKSTNVTNESTTAIPNPTDTSDQATEDTSTSGTTMTTTTVKPGPCDLNPCPLDSTCEERLGNRTCLCRPGLFYSEEQNTCSIARVFPSNLRFDAEFKAGMEDPASKVFRETADEIIKGISEAFSKPELQSLRYIGSTVLSLKRGSVIADVQNFFDLVSEVSTESVTDVLSNIMINNSKVDVELKNPCSTGYCGVSTDCTPINGLSMCTCKAGYIKSEATGQECIACLSGEKAVDSKKCEACPFGYSGFNCNENYLLIVVIVTTVLGALLFASFVAITVLGCRNTEKGDTSSDDGNDFTDLEFRKPTGIPRVPRANANTGWQPANLEPADSGDTYALVTKGRPESIAMERYNDSSSEDIGRYRSHPSSRNEKEYGNGNRNAYGNGSRNAYGNGNGNGNGNRNGNGNVYEYGSTAASSDPRGSKNPYYDPYEDMPRRY